MFGQMMTETERKKSVVIILVIVLIAAAAGLFFNLQQRENDLARERSILTATGTIEARTVMASFKVAGRIEQLLVDEGAAVEKGQELAVLESREIEAKVLQAEGACQAAEGAVKQAENALPYTADKVSGVIEQAQANLNNARQNYERAASLHQSGAISDSKLDEAANAYQAAQGKLNEALAERSNIEVVRYKYNEAAGMSEKARGALEEVQSALDNTHLASPISGYITQKNLEEGEMLNAGTPVFEISDLKNTYVKVFIDEKKIGRVHLQQTVEIRVDAYPDKVFKGQVVWINDAGQFAVQKAVNEQYSHDIRSFEVKIDVPNEDLSLKTGMTAEVKILEKES